MCSEMCEVSTGVCNQSAVTPYINNIVDSERVGGWKLLDPVWFSGVKVRGQSFCSLFFCCLSQLYCPGLLIRALLVFCCAPDLRTVGCSEARLILGNNIPVNC